jgi:acyl-coenzyme A thioesterase PaaI-like protein
MRKAEPGPVFCTARLLKLGKRLVVVEISIADENDELIAHGSCTYSIPPRD